MVIDSVCLQNFPLDTISYIKIGGPARYFALPKSIQDLQNIFKEICKENMPYIIVGGCSNILFSDKGFNGVVLSLKNLPQKINIIDKNIMVSGEVSIAKFLSTLYNKKIDNFNFWQGIPGTVLASICGNASIGESFLKELLDYIKIIDAAGNICIVKKENLNFGYRRNILQGNFILFEAGFVLPMQNNISKPLDNIRAAQPKEQLSLGCVFKNPKNDFAGRLIEKAGFKGYKINNISVSEKHANFFVNTGNGRACDYFRLINVVKEKVYEKFQINLELEIKLAGEF